MRELIEKLGAKVHYAGEDKIFTVINGVDVKAKKYKYVIIFQGEEWYCRHLESFVKGMLKKDLIKKSDIEAAGYKVCGRCGGKGIHESFRHHAGGMCFKCQGEGLFKK